ncbi:hypothetical protein CH249_14210 [Rhodococcus sp. 05-2255-3B1]|uniref:hypothetical protein n=1 Tax=unclassified Rhodococcus (in: high G+C Gram-positive bacteria) TaxID=192944 RepID=UPI000B9C028B|nr:MULTISPECIES: hypothetical protein [unclassified Rhodococcus (in: high G+C Gram-positive bacteria)]OZE10230.1 hypothetical protein CH249_14210 [Rhodococcus sp. 05-2255-3B1]OZE13600.1 hypothetical protein CH250_06925 [Rhodococcus sp. 05-2255-3C]OZE13687.1 hypothetical protein CH255_23730 [Rhodococcus sp. 05-2255-2A2]
MNDLHTLTTTPDFYGFYAAMESPEVTSDMRVIITCRGIGEPYGTNSLSAVTKNLDPKKYVIIELVWSADFGPVPRWNGNSFTTNVMHAEQALLDLIRKFPGAILLGYSGGAEVAGNVAAQIGEGLQPGLTIRAVVLISDPSRHKSQIIGVNRGGQGILGGRYIKSDRFQVLQFSAPGDPISELPEGNALADLAQLITSLSLVDVPAWMEDLRRKALKGALQIWKRSGVDWWNAYKWSLGYTAHGRHTCYLHEKMQGESVTYAERAASMIAGVR